MQMRERTYIFKSLISLTLEKRSKLGHCNSIESGNGCLLQLALGYMHIRLQENPWQYRYDAVQTMDGGKVC